MSWGRCSNGKAFPGLLYASCPRYGFTLWACHAYISHNSDQWLASTERELLKVILQSANFIQELLIKCANFQYFIVITIRKIIYISFWDFVNMINMSYVGLVCLLVFRSWLWQHWIVILDIANNLANNWTISEIIAIWWISSCIEVAPSLKLKSFRLAKVVP